MAGPGPGGRVKRKRKAKRPKLSPGFVPVNPAAFARGDFSGGIRPIKGGPASRKRATLSATQSAEIARARTLAAQRKKRKFE